MGKNPFLDSDIAEIARLLGPHAHAFSGKTVVLTGSEGFIGIYLCALFQHLSDKVLDKPVRVLAFDNFISSAVTPEAMPRHSCVVFQRHDVNRSMLVEEPVHYVLHAAGVASPVWYRTKPLETLDVSTVGTRNMLELARIHGAAYLQMSSSEIYGDPDPRHVPTSENYHGNVSCRGPRACYDEGKRMAETLCWIYHECFGVHVVVVRPFNVYGPGLRERDYRVLPSFASRIKAGVPLFVYGAGKQTRTFCYVVDAVAGFLLAMVRGVAGEVYNIGNPDPEISMEDLARRVQRLLGDRVQYVLKDYPDGYPSNEPQRRCPDIAKAHLHLGYQPVVDFDEGLRRFFQWTDETYTGGADPSTVLGER